jgi:acyl carrier protein
VHDVLGGRAPAALRAWLNGVRDLPSQRRRSAVLEAVRADVGHVLSVPARDAVRVDQPLKELGLDSLLALELRKVLGRRVSTTLPATLAFDYPTVAAIADYLVRELALDGSPAPAEPGAARPASVPVPRLSLESMASLSEEEAIARLQAELGELSTKP